MNRQQKINLALGSVVILVAVTLLLTQSREQAQDPVRLTATDESLIDRIRILRAGGDTISFSRTADGWHMTAPQVSPANPSRINALLYLLQARSFAQLDAGKLELQRFDLEQPVLSLELNGLVFHFGGTNPLEHRRYLLHGDTVHLVNDNLYHQLLQPPEFFIESEG